MKKTTITRHTPFRAAALLESLEFRVLLSGSVVPTVTLAYVVGPYGYGSGGNNTFTASMAPTADGVVPTGKIDLYESDAKNVKLNTYQPWKFNWVSSGTLDASGTVSLPAYLDYANETFCAVYEGDSVYARTFSADVTVGVRCSYDLVQLVPATLGPDPTAPAPTTFIINESSSTGTPTQAPALRVILANPWGDPISICHPALVPPTPGTYFSTGANLQVNIPLPPTPTSGSISTGSSGCITLNGRGTITFADPLPKPAGTITFSENGTVLGAVPVISDAADFIPSGLAVGSHTITVSYSGDANYAAFTSTTNIQIVPRQTKTFLNSSDFDFVSGNHPIHQGESLHLHASTYSPFADSITDPGTTGTITFFDGSQPLAVVPLSDPQLTITQSLAVGDHAITAFYSGDANFPSSTSAPFDVQVTAPVGFQTNTSPINAGNVGTATTTPDPQVTPTLQVTPPDLGSTPLVKIYNSTTGQSSSFVAYSPDYTGPVHVASAVINNTAYVVTSTGAGGVPLVTIRDGSGNLLQNFYAYVPAYTGGVEISVADVLGSGTPQIITSTDPGGQPLVNVYSFSGKLLSNFFAYSPDYMGGVRITTADISHSGHANIITTPAAGGSPLVNIFDGISGHLTANFYASDPSDTSSLVIIAGNVMDSGHPDLVVASAGAPDQPLRIYDGFSRSLVKSVPTNVSSAPLPSDFAHSLLLTTIARSNFDYEQIVLTPDPTHTSDVYTIDAVQDNSTHTAPNSLPGSATIMWQSTSQPIAIPTSSPLTHPLLWP